MRQFGSKLTAFIPRLTYHKLTNDNQELEGNCISTVNESIPKTK